MKIKPTLKYQLHENFKSLIYFYLSITAVTSMLGIFAISMLSGSGVVSMTHEITSAIYVFILALCSFKEYFHFFVQNGISRKTFFVSTLISMLISVFAISIIDQIFYCASFFITRGITNYSVFSITHLNTGDVFVFSPSGVAAYFCVLLAIYSLGSFMTLVFYRLQKRWKFLAAVSIPVVFSIVHLSSNTSTPLGNALYRLIVGLASFATSSVPAMITVALSAAAILLAGSWLLSRRAPVKV